MRIVLLLIILLAGCQKSEPMRQANSHYDDHVRNIMAACAVKAEDANRYNQCLFIHGAMI